MNIPLKSLMSFMRGIVDYPRFSIAKRKKLALWLKNTNWFQFSLYLSLVKFSYDIKEHAGIKNGLILDLIKFFVNVLL